MSRESYMDRADRLHEARVIAARKIQSAQPRVQNNDDIGAGQEISTVAHSGSDSSTVNDLREQIGELESTMQNVAEIAAGENLRESLDDLADDYDNTGSGDNN